MFYTSRPKTKFPRRFLALYLGIIVLGGTFLLGLYFGSAYFKGGVILTDLSGTGGEVINKEELPPHILKDVNFDLFWEVWSRVQEKYLKQPLPDTQLFYGAISGIVASLQDPYSVFLDPTLTERFMSDLAGTFDGIGAEIGIKKEQLVIVAPLSGTPAEKAGLFPGDAILKIDGVQTQGMPLDMAVSKIRGTSGTAVSLTIIRNGWDEPKALSIIREKITVQSVSTKELEGNVAYIKLAHFNETTVELFEKAAQEIALKNPKGIILDMRNNPGGLLEVGVRVASEWIRAPETVVIQEVQGGERSPFLAQGQARFNGIPTVVLVNQGSASASEIVAGALQDYKFARLVGEKTFGKGSVQTFEQLPGGSSLKLTIAHWLTPHGRQIDTTGISPDVEVKMTRENYENDTDPQLQKAIELLSGNSKPALPAGRS
ncbi:MAG: S41 family peptidase [bacterium]|nr:S41 family peptidase [bacterium]